MKHFYFLQTKFIKNLSLVLLSIILFSSSLTAQYSPGNPGIFGIDGDLFSGQRLNGVFTPAGSHDWFSKTVLNQGLFDTSDSTVIKNNISNGGNYSFSKRMQFPLFTVQDSRLLVDALYVRDHFGGGSNPDLSVFVSDSVVSNRNSQDPSTWNIAPGGDIVPSKTDIIDAYMHMRRDGTNISANEPSHLLISIASSILATGGDHHIDFELFKNELDINSSGYFNQAGPATTGGRNVWSFNTDGTIQAFGEMSISFSFNNTTVTDIGIYIWVSNETFKKVKPRDFSFSKDWNGSATEPAYGYARIVPRTGLTTSWASVNTSVTDAPAWGTNSKDLGTTSNNYYSTKYSVGQFAEAALDLTAMGVDPALGTAFDNCSSPFRRMMIKTRSSSAFSSALQDFAGPFDIFAVPTNFANIQPAALGCNMNSVQLSPETVYANSIYSWSTSDGNIVSGANTATPVIDRPGTYTLTATYYEGCLPSQQNVTVAEDFNMPVASAYSTGVLTNFPGDTVTIKGGDATASNYNTAFGGSQGLLWEWTGPNGFSSTSQDIVTDVEGTYMLVVTEQRNGCKDTAYESIVMTPTLNVKLRTFSGSLENNQVSIKWMVDENESANVYELQQSADGRKFTTIYTVMGSEKRGAESYAWSFENKSIAQYYRLVLVNKDNSRSLSKVILLSNATTADNKLQLLQNPVIATLQFNYQPVATGNYIVRVYDVRGVPVMQSNKLMNKGINIVSMPVHQLISGHYYLEVSNGQSREVTRFVK